MLTWQMVNMTLTTLVKINTINVLSSIKQKSIVRRNRFQFCIFVFGPLLMLIAIY